MRRAIHYVVSASLLLLLFISSQPLLHPKSAAAAAQLEGQQASAKPPQSVEQAVDPEKTGPIRHYIMIEMLNGVDLLLLDRWYITYHAPETLRRTERRQTKYVTFRTYTLPPEEIKAMNMWQGRMTEIGFANLADFNKGWVNIEEERKKLTLPAGELRGGFRSETVTIHLKPDEVFVEHPTPAIENPYFRWIFFYAYPEGVSQEAGEKWFHEVFAKELAAQSGVKRFVTYRSVRGETLTAAGGSPRWSRVAELWFDSHSEWKKAVYDARGSFTKPSWGGEFPFMKFQSTFIGENPDINFLSEKLIIP